MTYYEQATLATQACQALALSFNVYTIACWNWHSIENDRLPSTYTQEEYEQRQNTRSQVFNQMIDAMYKTRQLHDAYLKLESKLNQMGRMKKCT